MNSQLQIHKTEWIDKQHFLCTSVPLAVRFKVEYYLETSDYPPILTEEMRLTWDIFVNHADELLFPSGNITDRVIEMFNSLCDAIAFLAFVPGGVEIFGHRYEVIDGSGKA